MTPAPTSIFVASLGNAVTKATFFHQDQIYRTSVLTTEDPSATLSALTAQIQSMVGGKISPGNVIITGRQSELDKLTGKVEAKLVTDDQATTASERYLTKKFDSPTAILDVGPSAFLDRYPAEEIGRWLPFVVNLTDIENQLANKRLYPRVLPVTSHEYEIDLAVARQAIIKLGSKEGTDHLPIETKLNLVLTGGLLTEIPKVGDLMSVVLDSFYFKSGSRILLDQYNELLILGALLHESPDSELVTPELKTIGSALHLGGADRVVVDFGYQTKQRLSLESGEIVVLPAGVEQSVEIGVAGGKSARKYELSGGEGGVYLDNRVRPLEVISGSKDSIARIMAWRKSLETSDFTSSPESAP